MCRYGENGTSYATFLYTAEALKLLRAHDPATPFFLYLAYQNVCVVNFHFYFVTLIRA